VTPDAAASPGYVLLDWHGGFVDHDTLADRLCARPYRPNTVAGIILRAADGALHHGAPVTLEKRHSLPMPLPRFAVAPASGGAIALRVTDGTGPFAAAHGCYLVSRPDGSVVHDAHRVQAWEHFLALPPDAMQAIGALLDGRAIVMRESSGRILPPARLADAHRLIFDEQTMDISANLSTLRMMAALPRDSGAEIELILDTGATRFTCTRPA
jgi:hypothetical protein